MKHREIYLKCCNTVAKDWKENKECYFLKLPIPFNTQLQIISDCSYITLEDYSYMYPLVARVNLPFSYGATNSNENITLNLQWIINHYIRDPYKFENRKSQCFVPDRPYREIQNDVEEKIRETEVSEPNKKWYEENKNNPRLYHHFDTLYHITISDGRSVDHHCYEAFEKDYRKEALDSRFTKYSDQKIYFSTKEAAEDFVSKIIKSEDYRYWVSPGAKIYIHTIRKGVSDAEWIAINIENSSKTYISRREFGTIVGIYDSFFLFSKVFPLS